jgi:hypothetical protein
MQECIHVEISFGSKDCGLNKAGNHAACGLAV